MAAEQARQRTRARSKPATAKPARRRRRRQPASPPLAFINEAERLALQSFVVWAKGDPNLSVWEANFINDLGYHLVSDARYVLSPRRQQKIDEIGSKLGYATNEPPRMPDLVADDRLADALDSDLDGDDRLQAAEEDDWEWSRQDWHRMAG